jgi:hypothetical protein
MKAKFSSIADALGNPKEILVYKTRKAGWQKLFVSKKDPTVIPEDAIRLSICFFTPEQRKEALDYWKQMMDDSWSENFFDELEKPEKWKGSVVPRCPVFHHDSFTRHVVTGKGIEIYWIICQTSHCTFRPFTTDQTETGARARWCEAVNRELARQLRILKRGK